MNRKNRLPIHLPVAAPSEIKKANSNLNSGFRFVGTTSTSTSTSTSTVRTSTKSATSTTSSTQQQRGGYTKRYGKRRFNFYVFIMVAIVLMTLSAWTFIGVKMMNMKMDMNMKIIETEQQITDMDMQKHDSDHRETDMNNNNDNDNDNSNDNNNNNSNRILRSDIMNARMAYGAREVWLDLIRVGKQTMKAKAQANTTNDKSQKLHVMEIGVHSVEQCLEAAKESFHSHCFEPSPLSFDRIRQQLKKKLELPVQAQVQVPVHEHEHEQVNNDDIMKHLHLYNVAAGDTSGISLEFLHMGGTGDHIGEFDMWNMKAGPMPSDYPDDKKGEIIHVPSVRIDDVILPVGHQGQNQGQNKYQAVRPDSNVDGGPKGEVQIIDEVFAMKVDTQGFEFKVFEGMKESIKQHKIQYLLFEYWPKAMDLIAGAIDKSSSSSSSSGGVSGGVSDGDNGAAGLDRCEVAVNMLDMLVDAGYKLYALPLISHPSIVNSREKFIILKKARGRPLHDFREHCLFLRDGMEEQLNVKLSSNDTGGDSDGGCQMGVWTDVLAVAPHVELFTPSAPKDL